MRPLDGRVGFLNYEVSAALLARWADEAGADRNRFYLVNLRGRRNPLGHDGDRADLAKQLRQHEVAALFVDPFSRAHTGKSQTTPARSPPGWPNSTGSPAPMPESWTSSSTRTPDGTANGPEVRRRWKTGPTASSPLVTDPEDRAVRFMRAVGRDIDVDEDQLRYDQHTRTLSLTGEGNRTVVHATKRLDDLVAAVVEIVTAEAGIITSGIEAGLRDMGIPLQRGDTSKAARAAVDRGLVEHKPGKRRAQHHYLKGRVPPSDPDYPPGLVVSTPDPSYRDGATDSLLETTSTPDTDETDPATVLALIPGAVIDRENTS